MELDAQTIKELMTSAPGGSPIIKDNSGVVMEITNIEPMIAMLEHDWKGEYWTDANGDGNGAWVKSGKPVMNDEGTKTIISFIRLVSNKIVFTSDFSDTDIKEEMKSLLLTMRKMIISQYTTWNLEKHNFDLVVSSFEGCVLASWKTAKGRGFGTTLFGSVNERRIVGSSDKKKTLFGGLGIFGGGD